MTVKIRKEEIWSLLQLTDNLNFKDPICDQFCKFESFKTFKLKFQYRDLFWWLKPLLFYVLQKDCKYV